MTATLALWLLFGCGIIAMLVLELGVFSRKDHPVSFGEASLRCTVWFLLALAFGALVYYVHGREKGLQYLAAYLLEQSLSIDNMFVFVMIFHYFAIPKTSQLRILYWGILGAVVMRFIFIFAGIGLINKFHWMLYIFGLLLIFTGAKMALQGEEKMDPGRNPALRLLKRWMPLTTEIEGPSFFRKIGAAWHATPLFAALLVVEFSDVVFAIDSIPAVIAITRDPFVVYTSNVFAIMNLRSLYFMLAGLADRFRFLKYGISAILVFVGIKMIAEPVFRVPIGVSLAVIAGVVGISILTSLWFEPEKA
ncbi:MAG: TerC family protein [Elusimicrobia bacterium]|nr:TerC family protein [Elusimicrobiota bacterium]